MWPQAAYHNLASRRMDAPVYSLSASMSFPAWYLNNH